tara:strand:+ start:1021 stop:1356 length:336 start_codon:yes stop_codon:yes gene_type:complete
MKIVESYLEKGWGDSVDNPKLEDIKTAITETQKMDDEHGAFWVGVFDENDKEVVLEVSKNLDLKLILDPENLDPDTFNENKSKAANWESVLGKYELLLNGKVDELKELMNK